MTDAVYFISDLHLDETRPQVTVALGALLQRLVDEYDHPGLYILGDLFEVWVGDDDDRPLVREVTQQLRDFSDAGGSLYLMHGNRDFLIGEAFADAVGATLLDDPTVITPAGDPLLLMHGDSLCTRDEQYQQFRALARSEAWQAEILARPLDERRQLAAQLREVSRDAGSRKADDIMDVTPAEVQRVMTGHGCRTLIHGHTHRPARHEEASGTRWVLGDWDASGWYLQLVGNSLELIEFPINQ
jgi:UDP-2,3-diacylglucosamine hydrolase